MNPGASSMPGAHGYFDLQKANGVKLIVVDPRYTETAAHADLWLPLRPGSDAALSLAMLNVILNEFLYDFDFVENWCTDIDELRDHMEPSLLASRWSTGRAKGRIESRIAPSMNSTRASLLPVASDCANAAW